MIFRIFFLKLFGRGPKKLKGFYTMNRHGKRALRELEAIHGPNKKFARLTAK